MSTLRPLHSLAIVVAFSSLGCSEAVPLASEGAYSVSFLQVSTSEDKCIVGNHNAQVGGVTSVALDALVKDTVAGARIQCSVTAKDGGFSAAGLIEDTNANHLDFTIPLINIGASEANPAFGTVGFRSATTQNTYRSAGDKPCKFWFSSDVEQIDSGRIWVSFSCEAINDPGHDSSCQVSQGSVLAMQNCDQ